MFQVYAAHICYLVAEANFESYSETTRLCLIGADHLKFPRTFASPEAIQVVSAFSYLIWLYIKNSFPIHDVLAFSRLSPFNLFSFLVTMNPEFFTTCFGNDDTVLFFH